MQSNQYISIEQDVMTEMQNDVTSTKQLWKIDTSIVSSGSSGVVDLAGILPCPLPFPKTITSACVLLCIANQTEGTNNQCDMIDDNRVQDDFSYNDHNSDCDDEHGVPDINTNVANVNANRAYIRNVLKNWSFAVGDKLQAFHRLRRVIFTESQNDINSDDIAWIRSEAGL